ncbi:MAG: hypothetical protein JO211_05680 [Acidobacteriaceae bacterium]|nr:hypothetical protein [Acidobacteriaceae bacterium]
MHVLDEAWETFKREYDAACTQAARAARCQLTNELNQSLRRLRQYHSESDWVSTLIDVGSRFVQQIALFSLNAGVVSLRGQHKLNLPERFSFPISSAGAFASAVETKDPVVSLRTPSEVTEALSLPSDEERAHVLPIVNENRVVALLFAADQEYMDVNALELLAGMASLVLERRGNVGLHTHIAAPARSQEPTRDAVEVREDVTPLVSSNGVSASARSSAKPELPSWADLSEEQRTLHIQAQRFSRVTVAEMQLARPEACRSGREQANLYMFLKSEIDAARKTYRTQFMTIPSMVDYLHLELVRTAAEGDELKLGAEYPGQLV